MAILNETARLEPRATATAAARREAAPYMNPYLAGVGLGLVLLAAFVVMGRGLGASGAFSSLVAWLVSAVAPAHAQANEFYADYLGSGVGHPLKDWLVFEVLGVLVGGFLSGLLAGRVGVTEGVATAPALVARSTNATSSSPWAIRSSEASLCHSVSAPSMACVMVMAATRASKAQNSPAACPASSISTRSPRSSAPNSRKSNLPSAVRWLVAISEAASIRSRAAV